MLFDVLSMSALYVNIFPHSSLTKMIITFPYVHIYLHVRTCEHIFLVQTHLLVHICGHKYVGLCNKV